QMTTSTTSIDIMGLQAAYANLHTDQERDNYIQLYHDIISSFGGKTSYDADNRPLLVMRSNLWASGYDVDGTDQTSLGQFSGRVQQTYKHSVPRFFVPEHGTMFTLALVRFPPTATKEIRSEERFSRNAETDLVCRLLLEKKKIYGGRARRHCHWMRQAKGPLPGSMATSAT